MRNNEKRGEEGMKKIEEKVNKTRKSCMKVRRKRESRRESQKNKMRRKSKTSRRKDSMRKKKGRNKGRYLLEEDKASKIK